MASTTVHRIRVHLILVTVFLLKFSVGQQCFDADQNCADWVATNKNVCQQSVHIIENCRRSCGACIETLGNYDISRIDPTLQQLGDLPNCTFMNFYLIPKFTYGEEIRISLSDNHMQGRAALNYSAFAWSAGEPDEELHSENGYITVSPETNQVSLTTVMNNGFVTVEEGPLIGSGSIRFRLVDIGRISFSRDLPVYNLIREWTLIDRRTLEARLDMETVCCF